MEAPKRSDLSSMLCGSCGPLQMSREDRLDAAEGTAHQRVEEEAAVAAAAAAGSWPNLCCAAAAAAAMTAATAATAATKPGRAVSSDSKLQLFPDGAVASLRANLKRSVSAGCSPADPAAALHQRLNHRHRHLLNRRQTDSPSQNRRRVVL